MPVVSETIKAPGGGLLQYVDVRVRLVASTSGEAAGFVSASDYSVLGAWNTTTDATGAWSLTLVANALINPANTVYEVTRNAPGRPPAIDYISVPNGAGPYVVEDILTTAPTALASSFLASYQLLSQKGVASGYASLDSGGTIPDAQIPTTIARDSESAPRLVKVVAASDTPSSMRGLADYVCDGAADEVEINAAIAAAGPGGTVMLAPGNFLTAAPIVLNQHAVRLIGANQWRGTSLSGDAGQTAQVLLAAGANTDVIQVTARKNVIECVYIDGNSASNAETATSPTYADAVTTNGSATLTSATALFTKGDIGKTISGAGIPGGTTISAVASATSITLSANATATASGVTITITSRFTVGHGISYTKYDTSADLHVENCYVFNCAGNGFEIGACQVTLLSCYPETNVGYGFHVIGGACAVKVTRGVSANTKAGIYDESIGFTSQKNIGNNNYVGVECQSSANEGIVFVRGYGKAAIGCTIAHNDKEGIKVVGDAKAVTLMGNQIYDAGRVTNNTYSAIVLAQHVASGTWPISAIITGNQIGSDAGNKPKYGIEEAGGAGAHVITANVVKNTVADSIKLANAAPVNTVVANVCDNTSPLESYLSAATAVPILNDLNAQGWAVPLALTELLNQSRFRTKLDLTGVHQARLVARVQVVGLAGSELRVQYATNGAETTWDYLDASAGPALSLSATGTIAGAWVNLATAAKGDVVLRVIGINGDGATTPQLENVVIQFR